MQKISANCEGRDSVYGRCYEKAIWMWHRCCVWYYPYRSSHIKQLLKTPQGCLRCSLWQGSDWLRQCCCVRPDSFRGNKHTGQLIVTCKGESVNKYWYVNLSQINTKRPNLLIRPYVTSLKEINIYADVVHRSLGGTSGMLHRLMCVLITVISSQRKAYIFSWDMRDLPGSDFLRY